MTVFPQNFDCKCFPSWPKTRKWLSYENIFLTNDLCYIDHSFKWNNNFVCHDQVEFVLKHHKDLSPFLRRCTILQLSSDFFIPQDMGDDDSTVVDNDEPWSSSSSTGSGSDNMSFPCTEFVRKKRSGMHVCGRSANNCNNITEEDMVTSMSRRKGIPQRSPLC